MLSYDLSNIKGQIGDAVFLNDILYFNIYNNDNDTFSTVFYSLTGTELNMIYETQSSMMTFFDSMEFTVLNDKIYAVIDSVEKLLIAEIKADKFKIIKEYENI